MNRIYLLGILCFFAGISMAQKGSIKGQLIDPDKVSLIGATIVALDPIDSTLMGYTTTDNTGLFTLKGLKVGKYNIQFTYTGYSTIQREIQITKEIPQLELGTVTMIPDGLLLDAVNISGEYVPIKVTKDTIEFNADAFKTQPNAVVEDLLKKLPGVEVDSDGGIKIGGEDVKAVTVDGKDFFGKDPKMATKNLPANAVKKVQIFDKKSKTAQFTGIDDGQDEKTINLELKEDKKGGYFGNAMAGYGTDDRYESKAMINHFNKKTQLSIIGSLNNLNNTGINASDFSTISSGNSGGNANLNTNAPVSFGQSNVGLTKSITAGLNLNYDLGKKNKVNVSYYITKGNTNLIQTAATNSFVQSKTLFSDKNLTSQSGSLNHNVYSTLDLKIDSTSEMTIINSLTIRSSNDMSFQIDSTLNSDRQVLNINDQGKDNNVSATNYSGSINYRKKIGKKGRNYTIDGLYGNNTTGTTNQLLSEVLDENAAINVARSVFQFQNNNNSNNNYNIGGSYTEPLSQKWFWTLNGNIRNNRTDLLKDFFNLDPNNTSIRTFNTELSRSFDNTFLYYIVGNSLRYKGQNFISTLGVDFQQSNLDGIPSIGASIDKKFNYFLPKASIEFENTNLRLNYNTSIREPSMDQLQPIVDNSDPLNLYVGNPNLVPEYRHNMRVSYNFFDQFNFRSLFAMIRVGYIQNRITTSSFVDDFFIRKRTPLNTSSEQSMSANISFSSPLNVIKAKYRVSANTSLTRGINFINNLANDIDRWSNGFNVQIENKSKDLFDASIGSRWSFNNNIYKNNERLNTNFINQTYEGYVALFAGKGWTIDTKIETNIYGQGSFGSATTINLWQASVSKAFMNNKLTAKVRIFDILNQNQGVSRTASETYISETISNTIGRYVMLNLTYSLNALAAPSPSQGPPGHNRRMGGF